MVVDSYMLNVQRKIKYHPPKELNKQKSNTEQTIKKTNQQTNITEQKKMKMKKKIQKEPQANL